ncbi:RNA exonuclease 4 [Durusdinium trenchii]|uniref:RNA exonuclease 4 n=1 Tax=Durusdinium trenchii TaxID=1381693 RepID=A0ABP0M1R8_9DINO
MKDGKDVNVLKVLKKDAKLRQKHGGAAGGATRESGKAAGKPVPPAHQFFVSQNWKTLIQRRPDVAPKAKKEALGQKVLGIGENVVAMDCEMVGVGPNGTRSVLARVSIVDSEGKVLLDKYVRPKERVTDFRTPITGITGSSLFREGVISEDEARELAAKAMDGKIVVGHSLQNDFQALLLSHPHVLIRDTSVYRPLRPPGQKKTPSLRKLAEYWLQEKIQEGTHDSIQDAKTALRLYMLKSKAWEKQMRSAMQHHTSIDDEEDDGEKVDRTSLSGAKKKVKKGPKAKKKKVDFPTGEVAKATKKKKRKRAVPR